MINNSLNKAVAIPDFVYAVFAQQQVTAGNGFSVHFGHFGKQAEIPVLNVGGKFNDRTSSFSGTADAPYDSILVNLATYDLQMTLDGTRVWQYLASSVLQAPQHRTVDDSDVTAEVENALIELYLQYCAEKNDLLMVQGKGVEPTTFTFTDAYNSLLDQVVGAVSEYAPVNGVQAFTAYNYTQIGSVLTLTVASANANLRVGDIITFYPSNASPLKGLDFVVTDIASTTITATAYSNVSGIASESGTGVAGTAHYVNELNITANLARLISAVPNKFRSTSGFGFYMSTRLLELYKVAQANNSVAGGFDPSGEKAMEYLGKPIYGLDAMPPNMIISGSPRNFHVVSGNEEDFNQLLFKNMKDVTLDYEYRVRASFKTGVGVYIDDAIRIIK
ncbi:MAG: hypothetical protein KatS3mg031_2884 [Chitinophagales bacterium]|nr:MAG: hypothetical protein KatS3mg031_2884 [Chitinophagales bacterium]